MALTGGGGGVDGINWGRGGVLMALTGGGGGGGVDGINCGLFTQTGTREAFGVVTVLAVVLAVLA